MKYYAILSEKNIEILSRKPCQIEIEKFCNLASLFGKFLADLRRTEMLTKSFNEMLHAFTCENITESNATIKDINRFLMNYLASFRAFLDHWETYIKRNWKADNTYITEFKKITAFEYDNCMDYRITYRLRNYAQHCEIPISQIIDSINNDEKVDRKVFINRDRLLNSYDGWKKGELAFLKQQKENIELLPILKSGKEALMRIQQKLMLYRVDENFISKAIEGLELNKKYKVKHGSIALIEFSDATGKAIEVTSADDYNGARMGYQKIPKLFCEDILKRFILEQPSIRVFSGLGVLQQVKTKGFPEISKYNGTTIIFLGNKYVTSENVNWVRLYEKIITEKEITKFASVYADISFKVDELQKVEKQFARICDVLYF